MMKESQRQNGMRCSSLMPDKGGKPNDSGANERSLHQSDLSLTEIDKRPHQATASGAGEKRARKIESADAMSDALAHSGDNEETSYNGNRDMIRKAQRHETCVTISVPRSGPATLATAHALLAAPSALPRLSGGYTTPRRTNGSVATAPAPMPWMARAPMNSIIVRAMTQSPLPTVNATMPMRLVHGVPSDRIPVPRSASIPPRRACKPQRSTRTGAHCQAQATPPA